MSAFEVEKLKLEGSYLIHNFYSGDNRGEFEKFFEREIYAARGIPFTLNETFATVSSRNVIRGMHFQINSPQAKLVSVLQGKVWDVIVDLRPDSDTFRQWVGVELGGDSHKSLYVPRGFAHGFFSLEDKSIMLYQCQGPYHKETDTGIRFDDPDLGIRWPVSPEAAIHSERDLGLMSFQDYLKNPMKL